MVRRLELARSAPRPRRGRVPAGRGGPLATDLRFLDDLTRDALHEVVWVTKDLERRAVDGWLRRFAEHGLSLADAVGFEVMRERGLHTAFALDRHFAVAGFEVLP